MRQSGEHLSCSLVSRFSSVRICVRLDNLFFEISGEFSINLSECSFFTEKSWELVTALTGTGPFRLYFNRKTDFLFYLSFKINYSEVCFQCSLIVF